MKVNIIQIGNSQGVRIPKILLEQLKFEKIIELEILPEGLLMRPAAKQSSPRDGWAEQFASALAEGDSDDKAEFADWTEPALTSFDKDEW